MSETSQASQQTGVDNKLITDGKNSMTVSCERCGSIILLPALGHIENVEVNEYVTVYNIHHTR